MKNLILNDKIISSDDFKKILDDNTSITFSVENSAFDNFCELSKIEKEQNINFKYKLKGLSVETLTKIFKYVIDDLEYVNPEILTNLLLLVKNYNTLDDSFFESSHVAFTSMEDFIDLKMNLKQDLKKLNSTTIKFYMSAIKSMNKFECSFIDNPVKIPKLVKTILLSADIFTISSMLTNMDDFNTNELMLVEDAYYIVSEIASKMNTMDFLFNNIQKEK